MYVFLTSLINLMVFFCRLMKTQSSTPSTSTTWWQTMIRRPLMVKPQTTGARLTICPYRGRWPLTRRMTGTARLAASPRKFKIKGKLWTDQFIIYINNIYKSSSCMGSLFRISQATWIYEWDSECYRIE